MNVRARPTVSFGMALVILGGVLAGWLYSPARAHAAPVDGLFLSVPNPIDDKAVQLIKRKVDDAILVKKRPIQAIVFDFNPTNLPAATSEYNSANSLAEFILDLRFKRLKYPQAIKTVAFVHDEATRHTVLPVAACQQIFMSDEFDAKRQFKAKLGDVAPDGSDVFNKTIYSAYNAVAAAHDTPDLVMRLLDRNLELRQVEYLDGSTHFVSQKTYQQTLEEKKAAPGLWEKAPVPPGLERGRALFDPDQARKFGLSHGIVRDRAALATALKLQPRSLVEDHLLDQQVKVAIFQVRGRLDKGTLNDLRTQVGAALRERHNFLIFQLESSGGDTRDIGSFANWLADVKVNETNIPARTVAYIPSKASIGAATFIALGCQEIVMGPESFLADFNYLNTPDDKESLTAVREMLVPLTEKRGYPAVLFEASLTPGMAVYHVKDRKDPSEERLISAAQFMTDKKSEQPRWENHGRIEAKEGELLKIPAERAQHWRIALETGAPIQRVEDVYPYFGLDPQKITVSKPGWLFRVAEFFREPIVNFMLIMIGILGLIMELKMPGTTVPGVLAAVCFVLFFWSFSFVGEFTMLASLLFVLGLILVGIEIFVLPGFGFTGISGIFLIIFSMVLVTLDNVPQTSQEWVSVGARITTLGLGLVGGIIGAFVLAHYLPSIPYANRLVLRPPEEGADDAEAGSSFAQSYAHLLGAIGVAATTLRPAGKAQFGEEFYDVVAEGDYVNPGSRIQVVEIEGYRIVVKEVV